MISFTMASCSQDKWEYKTYKVLPEDPLARDGSEAFKEAIVAPSEEELNKLGKDGWELVSMTPELETAYPNFGKADYVTGIQPNIRTMACLLIFKRKVK